MAAVPRSRCSCTQGALGFLTLAKLLVPNFSEITLCGKLSQSESILLRLRHISKAKDWLDKPANQNKAISFELKDCKSLATCH